MQELKASFLDETSTMSGGGGGAGGDGAPLGPDDDASQGSMKMTKAWGQPGPNEMAHLAPIKSVTAGNLLEYKY